MGHGITATDRVLSVREVPWHRLGKVWDHYPTRREAQDETMPWEPIPEPIYRSVPKVQPAVMGSEETGLPYVEYEEVPGQKAIARSDNGDTLGVVSGTFGLVTNEEMWDVAEAVGNLGGSLRIETAGTLNGGRQVWILLRQDEPVMIAGEPLSGTFRYFALQNGHDGSSSFRGQGINTRIVCWNTSAAADLEASRNNHEFKFAHTSKVSERIEQAKDALIMWRAGTEMWQQAMTHLYDLKVTAEQREAFVQAFQPYPKEKVSDRVAHNVETSREELRDILRSATCEGIDGTAYGLFQAGIEWQQHVRRTRAKSERARMESYFKRAVLTDNGLRHATLKLAEEAAVA